MEKPQSSPAVSFLQTCAIVFVFLSLNAGLSMTNKYALGIYGFRFPIGMTMCHMVFSFLALMPIMMSKQNRAQHMGALKQWKGLGAIGVFLALNVCTNNISLVYITLSLNQVIRSSIPVVAAVFAVLIERKVPTHEEGISLVVLTAGVTVAVWEGSVSGSPGGIALCITSVVSNAVMMSFTGRVMTGEKIDALRLTFYTAPVSCSFLMPFYFYREASNFALYYPVHKGAVVFILGVTSVMALAYNVLHTVLIHKISAVTTTVLGEAKVVALLILSAMFLGEDRQFTARMTFGCALALVGFGMYSHCKLQQRTKALVASAVKADEEARQFLLPKSSSASSR